MTDNYETQQATSSNQAEQPQNSRLFNPNEHLMQIGKGNQAKDYLPVNWRLVWFRSLCPNGTIETEIIHLDLDRETQEETYVWNSATRSSEKVIKRANGFAVFRATVKDGRGGIATGTKSEKAASFPDYIEKAETGAIGRALAALGYGTQFAGDEFEERHRIVDAPVDRGTPEAAGRAENGNSGDEQTPEQRLEAFKAMAKQQVPGGLPAVITVLRKEHTNLDKYAQQHNNYLPDSVLVRHLSKVGEICHRLAQPSAAAPEPSAPAKIETPQQVLDYCKERFGPEPGIKHYKDAKVAAFEELNITDFPTDKNLLAEVVTLMMTYINGFIAQQIRDTKPVAAHS